MDGDAIRGIGLKLMKPGNGLVEGHRYLAPCFLHRNNPLPRVLSHAHIAPASSVLFDETLKLPLFAGRENPHDCQSKGSASYLLSMGASTLIATHSGAGTQQCS